MPQQPPTIVAPASRISTRLACHVGWLGTIDRSHVDELGHAGVGFRDEDDVGRDGPHSTHDPDELVGAVAAVAPDGVGAPGIECDDRLLGRDAHHRVAARVEGHRRDERDPGRHPPNALDGGLDLDEIGHRLDPDQVHAARDERRRLLGEDVDGLVVLERPGRSHDRPGRADVAGDERAPAHRVRPRSEAGPPPSGSARRPAGRGCAVRGASRLPPNVLVMTMRDPASR